MSDRAPTVYTEDGKPMKVRLVGHECVGRVDRGMFGCQGRDGIKGVEGKDETIYFEKV